jgi:hypothetical protein
MRRQKSIGVSKNKEEFTEVGMMGKIGQSVRRNHRKSLPGRPIPVSCD